MHSSEEYFPFLIELGSAKFVDNRVSIRVQVVERCSFFCFMMKKSHKMF